MSLLSLVGKVANHGQLWIGVMCGGVLTAYLMSYRVKSAIVIGISVVSILSWPYALSLHHETPH
jgi:xanthine/uracil/vitamin C permease (AzgA family)